ncbi:MAG TPA: SDR family oxidoreductase [Acetobacteraceae bacterium]|jgi:NAD(P)-dependent dehydrogenase (short-subunit alcohol dehydrogenase family)|nr:SDR family oxidoreductase [Acetobacteraceae bacterium]
MAPMQDRRMEGKVAIITGAGSRAEGIGNGRASSVLLARHGTKVALVDENPDWAMRTQEMIEAEGGVSHVVPGDVTIPADCARIVREAVRLWGRLDVLVNNVGIAGPPGTAVDVDLDAWDRALRVNVTSMMLMAKFAIPEMERNGGAIINIASYAGLFGGHPSLLYPTSKGAVVNMTRAMAAHHAPQGIRVNAVAPGMVYTPMVYAGGMSEETRAARRNRSLLKTEGSGWDVGNAVLYLASEEARWVTGIVLPVDAGASAAPSAYPARR